MEADLLEDHAEEEEEQLQQEESDDEDDSDDEGDNEEGDEDDSEDEDEDHVVGRLEAHNRNMIDPICTRLRENRAKHLQICSTRIRQDCYDLAKESLSMNQSIQSLFLSTEHSNHWGPAGNEIVYEFIQKSTSLQKLTLSTKFASDQDCRNLFQAIKANPTIECINFSLFPCTAECMVELLATTQTLKTLLVHAAFLSDQTDPLQTEALGRAIGSNERASSIKALSLQYVDALAATVFASMNPQHSIESIYLRCNESNCEFSSQCCSNLGDLIKRSQKLKVLAFHGSFMTIDCWKPVLGGLRENNGTL